MSTDEFLKLLAYSYEIERGDEGSGSARSHLEYLGEFIFDFTTYDSEMSELFAEKAVSVCAAIGDRSTFEFIKNPEQYKWFLLMCNMPFFAQRLHWGSSIRGAWWDHYQRPIVSTGLWYEGDQLMELVFNGKEDWSSFIDAVVQFAKEEE